MKRSGHVTLCTTPPPLASVAGCSASNRPTAEKKLRKRRELNAMAVSQGRVMKTANKKASSRHLLAGPLYASRGLESSSEDEDGLNDDEDEDDDDEDSAIGSGSHNHAYMNLMKKSSSMSTSRAYTGRIGCLRRNRKFVSLCHNLCLAFVVLSGFIVLLTISWLHFSLRAQTQDINAQINQGYLLKKNTEKKMASNSSFFWLQCLKKNPPWWKIKTISKSNYQIWQQTNPSLGTI